MVRKVASYLLLSITLFIPLLALMHPGFPITHDGQDHIVRIANFYMNLESGIVIPRWAPNLNWGYGHPVIEFLYPLPSYTASFFHFLGFSFLNSTKIVLGSGMFFSGITMFLWLKSFWSEKASFLGAVLYVIAPYRFIDVYVRGDIGENLAFIFIPLVLFFIQRLGKKVSTFPTVLGGIALCLLILSHNAVSLMMFPIIVLYMVFQYAYFVNKKEKKKFILFSFLFLLFGFGLAAFFWIPGLLEGKFTLRNIVTAGSYKDRFVSFAQLVYGPWSYGGTGMFTLQLGVVNWIAFFVSLASLPFLWKSRKKEKRVVFGSFLIIMTLLAVFFMLPQSFFIWNKILLLQNFQFPWRFLAVTVFTTAVLGGFLVEAFPQRVQTGMFIFLFALILFFNKNYWHAQGYFTKPESFFTGVYYGTTDTGESAPIWSVRFMEHTASSSAQVISGTAAIHQTLRKVDVHAYIITATTQARILENTLYFPGWRIFIDGSQVPIQFQDENYRGLMTFMIPQGTHSVRVIFQESKLRLLSDIISITTLVGVIFISMLSLIKKK